MIPSFFALFSKAGIACAADTDHTIYRLSKDLPIALAVNPASPIPWDAIIEDYKRSFHPEPHELFADYASDFELYLSTLRIEEKWRNLSQRDANVMFFGYGSEDIFPSVYDVNVMVNENGALGFDDSAVHSVTQKDSAFFHMLGDFDSVSTLLFGSTARTRDFFFEKHVAIWEKYSDRVMAKFKGTEYEPYVKEHLITYDYKKDIASRINASIDKTLSELSIGIGSFSIEDMVTAVEAIIIANDKLSHLRSGENGKSGDAKEIAVITIPEGLSWIKHSLYHRRNEL